MVEYRAAGLRTQAPEQERKGGKWNMEGLRKYLERIGLYADAMLYFAIACAISYVLSGYCGLYSSQTILYSKLRAEFINVHTKE